MIGRPGDSGRAFGEDSSGAIKKCIDIPKCISMGDPFGNKVGDSAFSLAYLG